MGYSISIKHRKKCLHITIEGPLQKTSNSKWSLHVKKNHKKSQRHEHDKHNTYWKSKDQESAHRKGKDDLLRGGTVVLHVDKIRQMSWFRE